MCVVSMVTDHYIDKWKQYPVELPGSQQLPGWLDKTTWTVTSPNPITPAEIAEFRQLLERAKQYDIAHNEPHCELAEKQAALIAVAAALGVKIEFPL